MYLSEMTNIELITEMKRISIGCVPVDINPCYTCEHNLTSNECKDCRANVIEEIKDELEDRNVDWEGIICKKK